MRSASTLACLVSGVLLTAASPASSHDCAQVLGVTKVPGSAGLVRIETARRVIVAREPRAPRAGATATFTVRALAATYDTDNNTGTIVDTLLVTPGSTIHFQWVSGVHTLSDGLTSADIGPGTRFDYILDAGHPVFDTTLTTPGTMNYFCQVHEFPDRNQSMAGTIVVAGPSGVPGASVSSRVSFSRPPSPNPSRSAVSFAIALPAELPIELSVLDITGRTVAVISRERVGAGEHAFRWDGRSAAGNRAAPGRYIVRLRAGGVTESRSFSLLR